MYLENAITFVRKNILYNSLIRIEEIKWIVETMLKFHGKKQLFFDKPEH